MTFIQIYTTQICPYCIRAKALLNKKGFAYEEIDVTHDQEGRLKLVELSGGRKTVPQIFIHGQSIGGCDDLYGLESEGRLDALVNP